MINGASATHASATEVAVDAHVHLHDPAHDTVTLEAAAYNFSSSCPVPSRIGVLMLADMAGGDAFERLRATARRPEETAAPLRLTAEATSLWFDAGDWRLLIAAGRQIVTAERLEVLALATDARLHDGLPLDAVLDRIAREDALAVLPWGCGKWLGARGALVQRTLERDESGRLFLGDNGGRPTWWRVPLLQDAASAHLRVLPGSDPLPMNREWRRVGTFGFALAVSLSADTPAADLKRALRDPERRMRRFGNLETSVRFVRNQLSLRLRSGRNHKAGHALRDT